MCGIAGIMCLQRKPCEVNKTEAIVKRMTDLMIHRGPDGEGQTTIDEGHVFLGHRRLAIIDLSDAAKQPMQSMDGRFFITYNGEIYNYRELREELRLLGHCFATRSDTEVLLKAYEVWGIAGIKKLNGIFAFAIWDNYKKELIIARDRYGTKPLYYAQIADQFVFASEYKAILAHPDFQRKLNLNALKEYFTFQNIFSNITFMEGINIFEAGSYIRISYEDKVIPDAVSYWDYYFYEEKDTVITVREYEEELNRLFVQAVKRQLVSDVSVGTYLSGGIDSGSITAIASQYIPDLKTFTCGFDLHSASGMELAYDEREKAEYMSYLFKTEHYEMVLKAGDMERCMKDLVWHLEDPRVGQSYPNFYAAKLSSNFVKVVLAGSGGDELFAGYPWRYYRAVNCRDFDEYVDKYFQYWQRLLKQDEIEKFFAPIYGEIKDYSTEAVFRNVFSRVPKEDLSPEQSVNYSLYLETKTFLHGLLIVEDKLSMAHGLETRVPFLDNDLVDFAMKLPVSLKLASMDNLKRINENDVISKAEKGYLENKDGKLMLRNVMSRYVPQEIATGKKQGFSAPDASWFRGESIDYVKSIIFDLNSAIYNYIDKKCVYKIFDQHIFGIENRRLLIWSIINFDKWLKIFMKQEDRGNEKNIGNRCGRSGWI